MNKKIKSFACFALCAAICLSLFAQPKANAFGYTENELPPWEPMLAEDVPTVIEDYTTPDLITVEEAQAKIAWLEENLAGKFFTANQETCSYNERHNYEHDNCLLSNITNKAWLRNLVGMGALKYSLMPGQYRYDGKLLMTNGYQCYGFANFAHWYIFAQNNTDLVTPTLVATGPFTYETVSKALPGDVIRIAKEHSAVFINCDETGVNVIDCNATYPPDYASCMVNVRKIKYNPEKQIGITGAKNYIRPGDVNDDGKVDKSDAELAYSYCNGFTKTLTEKQFAAADLDENGKITVRDVMLIYSIINN